jgi:hypothetical protein
MRPHVKLMLAALTATLVMGLAVSSATAGRLSTSNTRFRVTWNQLRLGDEAGGLAQTCRVTLEGSFHSATIRKIAGTLIGAITKGIVDSNNCRGTNEPHRLTIQQETLPWHLTYESFSGTLPNITAIQFLLRRYDFAISANIIGITIFCLYLDFGRAEENLVLNAPRNGATGALSTVTEPAGRHSGLLIGLPAELCPRFFTTTGTGEIFLLGNTTRISVTLI